MKKILIKIGAYFILISGIIITALLVISAIILLINFSGANLLKKGLVVGGLILAAVLVFALSFSIFESMHDLLVVEDEIKQILNKKKSDD